MLNDQDIADLHRSSAQLDGVDADTHITVNPRQPSTPTPPEFSLPTRRTQPAPTVVSEHVVTPPERPYVAPAPTISTRTVNQVNWGKVAKGVATVAIVGVACVAAFYFIGPAVSSFITSMGWGSSVASATEYAAGAGSEIASTLQSLGEGALTTAKDALSATASYIQGGASALFGSSTSTTAPLTAAQVSASNSALGAGVGALAAGGVAAVGFPMAKAALAMPMVDTVHQTIATPAPTGLEDGGASLIAPAKKAALASYASQASVADAAAAPDHHHSHEEAMAQKYASTSSKMAHHAGEHMAAHEGTEGTDTADLPDAPEEAHIERRSRSALSRATTASKSWAEKAQGSHYSHALASTGSHAEAVRTAHPERTAPTPRDSAFASELTKERAALDAALEPAR